MLSVDLLVPLVTGESDMLSVHNNNMITTINVGSVNRLMLAANNLGNLTCQTTDGLGKEKSVERKSNYT